MIAADPEDNGHHLANQGGTMLSSQRNTALRSVLLGGDNM